MSADHVAEVLRRRRVEAAREAGGPRSLADEFPDAFAGLLPFEMYRVAMRARVLANCRIWDIEEHHLNQARHEYDTGEAL